MKLSTIGREYAHFTVSVSQATALTVSFDNGTTWTAMERPSNTEARVLVAGPSATGNPVGTVALAAGRNAVLIRLVASSESVVRAAGSIFVCPTADL